MNIKLKNCILKLTGIPTELATDIKSDYKYMPNDAETDVVLTSASTGGWKCTSITVSKNHIYKINCIGTNSTPVIVVKWSDGTIEKFVIGGKHLSGTPFIAKTNGTLYVNSNDELSIKDYGNSISGNILNYSICDTSSDKYIPANVSNGDSVRVLAYATNAAIAKCRYTLRDSEDAKVGDIITMSMPYDNVVNITDTNVSTLRVDNLTVAGSTGTSVQSIYIIKS